MEENLANLEAIHALVRKHRPSAALVFTLSPVPLVATFRPVSCITANSVSKAILRVAVDELMRAHADDGALFYWPSYEIVKEYVKEPYTADNRHPRPPVIELVMRSFATHYLVDPYSDEQMNRLITRAQETFSRIPELGEKAIKRLIERGILTTEELTALPLPLLATLVGGDETATRLRRTLAVQTD